MFGLPTVKHNVMFPQLRDRGYVVSGARPLIVIMSVLLGYCAVVTRFSEHGLKMQMQMHYLLSTVVPL